MLKHLTTIVVTSLAYASLAHANPLSGQITVHPDNPMWLTRSGGAPIFMCGPGDPEGFLYRGTLNPDGTRAGDQATLINTLRGTGANCIYFQAVRSHGGDGDATHNPFNNHNKNDGINEAVLDQWETWFQAMDSAGIVIYFFFYDDSASVWSTGDTVGAAEQDFINTLVDRFEHHRNLIWCVAEEYSEAFSQTRIENLATAIRNADDHDHVLAVHQRQGLSFDFATSPQIDQFAIQWNVATADDLHDGMVTAWNNANGMYQLNMSEAAGFLPGADSRLKSWACAMGGAYVMIIGMDIASTPISDLQDCGRLAQFMESTNFTALSPHDELAHAGTKWVLAKPGEEYIAYSPNLTADMGLKQMTAGTYDFRWLDCATGAEETQAAVEVGAGDQSWRKPSGLGGEVVLSVRESGSVSVESDSWAQIKARYR